MKEKAIGIPLSLTLARNDTTGIGNQAEKITPAFNPLSS
jgi:hypothetical protein